MKLLTSFTVLVLLSLTAALESKNGADRVGSVRLYAAGLDEPKKVAIIGAGVAGSTTAYFLRQALSDHVWLQWFVPLFNIDTLQMKITCMHNRWTLLSMKSWAMWGAA
jgi:hypothetical protein